MTGTAVAFLAIPEALVLGLIATGAGRRICARLLPEASPLEATVFGFPVGMGLLSLIVTGLLFAKLPALALPFVLGALLIGAAAWARVEAVDTVRDLRDFARESPVLAAILAASALVGMIGCLAPETGWDTGVYHFAMARLRAEQGGMLVRLDVPHSYRPAQLGMLHVAGFVLNGEALASLINESFYFAGLALARLWGLRLAGPRGGLYAALAWLGVVSFVLRMNGGDVEVGQAVYLGLLLFALVRLREGGGGAWRVLAGGALGLMIGMKYSSLNAGVVVAAVWVVVRLFDRAPLKALLADGAVIGLLALSIGGSWYVRNKLETGSFFYPYAATVTGTATEEGDAGGSLRPALQALGMDGVVLLGAAALLLSRAGKDGWAGLVPVLLLAWMLWQHWGGGPKVANAVRYASACWLPLIAFGGALAAGAVDRGGLRRAAVLGVLVVALALGQGALAARNLRKLPVAIGLQSRDAYLEGRVSTYRAIREAESALPAGKRILLAEERVYYCRAPFLGASDIQAAVDLDRIRGEAELRRFLEDHSIGAIVVDRSEQAKIWRFRNLEKRLGAAWPPPGLRVVTVAGDASLYRIE